LVGLAALVALKPFRFWATSSISLEPPFLVGMGVIAALGALVAISLFRVDAASYGVV
jgi:hypothetical protein